MSDRVFNPPPDLIPAVIDHLSSSQNSLGETARFFKTSLDALCLWMATPQVSALISSRNHAFACKAHLCVGNHLAHAACALATIISDYIRTDPEDFKDRPGSETFRRHQETIRKAVSTLLRIGKFIPGTVSVSRRLHAKVTAEVLQPLTAQRPGLSGDSTPPAPDSHSDPFSFIAPDQINELRDLIAAILPDHANSFGGPSTPATRRQVSHGDLATPAPSSMHPDRAVFPTHQGSASVSSSLDGADRSLHEPDPLLVARLSEPCKPGSSMSETGSSRIRADSPLCRTDSALDGADPTLNGSDSSLGGASVPARRHQVSGSNPPTPAPPIDHPVGAGVPIHQTAIIGSSRETTTSHAATAPKGRRDVAMGEASESSSERNPWNGSAIHSCPGGAEESPRSTKTHAWSEVNPRAQRDNPRGIFLGTQDDEEFDEADSIHSQLHTTLPQPSTVARPDANLPLPTHDTHTHPSATDPRHDADSG